MTDSGAAKSNNKTMNVIPDIPEEGVGEVVSAWLETLKTPTISGAYLSQEDENFLNITASWVASDLAKKERITFTKSYGVLKTSLHQPGGPVIHVSSPTPVSSKLTCVSHDGLLRAVLVEKNGGSGDEKKKSEILQIWDNGCLLKSFDLGEFDKHKSVYTIGAFGAMMKWSPDKKRLAYVAEKKVPEGKSFFCVNPKDGQKGEEFALRQTWGEQMTELMNSVFVVLDIEKGDVKVLDLPEDEYPVDVQWQNTDTLIGTTYKIPLWRLGLIYCSNRESTIFSVNADGTDFKFISERGRGASSPRVRPDGGYVIWAERPVDRPHQRALSIMGRSLGDPQAPVIRLCEASPSNQIPLYDDLPKRCWGPDGKNFYYTTPSNGTTILVQGTLEDDGNSASFRPLLQDGVDSLLWSAGNFLLISRSSCLETPSLELLDISSSQTKRTVIVKGNPVISPDKFKGSRQLFWGKSTAPSIYVGPECGSVPPNSVPLVVWPHGGPHAVFLDAYTPQIAFLLRLGYAVLQVNYIGSLGSKKDETDDLLGHIGSLDVQDCQSTVDEVLQTLPCLRADRTFIKGGSHGGFLACHLTSSFPDVYRAAVVRNPVCNLNVMIGTSDITDWQIAECGLAFPDLTKDMAIPIARSDDETKIYRDRSPITYVEKVKAPILICLGSEDIRVPMSQGLAFYRALIAQGKIAEVRVYPDCHPLMKLNVLSDVMIHTALWFKRFM